MPFFLIDFYHICYPQSQSLSVFMTVLVAFIQIPFGVCGVWSQRLWWRGPLGWRMVAVAQPRVLQQWLVVIICCSSSAPTSLPSPLLCFLPSCLGTAICCLKFTVPLDRAVQGTHSTFSPPLFLSTFSFRELWLWESASFVSPILSLDSWDSDLW